MNWQDYATSHMLQKNCHNVFSPLSLRQSTIAYLNRLSASYILLFCTHGNWKNKTKIDCSVRIVLYIEVTNWLKLDWNISCICGWNIWKRHECRLPYKFTLFPLARPILFLIQLIKTNQLLSLSVCCISYWWLNDSK